MFCFYYGYSNVTKLAWWTFSDLLDTFSKPVCPLCTCHYRCIKGLLCLQMQYSHCFGFMALLFEAKD